MAELMEFDRSGLDPLPLSLKMDNSFLSAPISRLLLTAILDSSLDSLLLVVS